ncbi:hypothetical protein MHW47_10845 [Streptomyces sp. OfavH-34-F]|uniref:hypothetical protein n=1 Tax=Streptomyces sp. OfavH-34-F TaxID=2917760 RepID=UPI001EF30FF5|nr:hypothetical protein [Streptomyces sp. OfavH-34-F]MCG7524931.1 hypothetical protein [Streptomyces sp. OfavH-34-F]
MADTASLTVSLPVRLSIGTYTADAGHLEIDVTRPLWPQVSAALVDLADALRETAHGDQEVSDDGPS